MTWGGFEWSVGCWVSFIKNIPLTCFRDPFDWICGHCGREW